ncbi:MAG: hypothetical protein HS104_30395 [Polyangiaceae bacterium]|nr:hypothetical protein [Polyangiaceae bacterium]MCL4755614.1 hypothetical protein [Myxococcales bacterium]
MIADLSHYALLSRLFDPPAAGFAHEVRAVAARLRDGYPEAAAGLERFAALLPAEPVALAELFVRTFDIQAITTLDLGYTLFGEDYKRGALLAGLSAEHRRASNDCGTELGDHLPNVLRLLAKMPSGEVRDELVHVIVGPAVREMCREFEPARITKKEEIYKKHHKTIIEHADDELRAAYCHAIGALYAVLRADFELKVSLPVEQAGGFVRSVDSEMSIESCASGTCGPSA